MFIHFDSSWLLAWKAMKKWRHKLKVSSEWARLPQLFEITLKSTYYFVYILFTSRIFFVIFGSLIKPEKVATSKKQNEQLKSQIAELSSQLKEKCRTSDLTCESTTGTSDHEMEWSLQFYSDSYNNLNSLQANTVRELKCLSDRKATEKQSMTYRSTVTI